MSLTDILTFEGVAMENLFSRGNVGALVDVQGERLNEFTLPALGATCDYPPEDDVRSGVSFDTFTGNLELPAEADVLAGVNYGAGGTEFTGAASGGGGGEEIIYNLTTDKLEKRLTDKVYMDI